MFIVLEKHRTSWNITFTKDRGSAFCTTWRFYGNSKSKFTRRCKTQHKLYKEIERNPAKQGLQKTLNRVAQFSCKRALLTCEAYATQVFAGSALSIHGQHKGIGKLEDNYDFICKYSLQLLLFSSFFPESKLDVCILFIKKTPSRGGKSIELRTPKKWQNFKFSTDLLALTNWVPKT